MVATRQLVQVSAAAAANKVTTMLRNPDVNMGALDFPLVAKVRVSSAGVVLASSPSVDGINGPIKSVAKDSAGRYTVVLADLGQTAAQVAPELTSNTSELYGSAVVTDATHIAVATDTNGGVATDSAFVLSISFLQL